MRYIIVIGVIFLLLPTAIYGTHNRAGEITYSQTGPLTIVATVTTYTKTSSSGADRDSLTIFWGDGTSEIFLRTNGVGEEVPGEDIKINFYVKEHTYPGRGMYTISFQDPNRVNNIQNVNYPNSVDVPFFVQTTFTLIESQFQGPNNSVLLLQPPIDFACVGRKFIHNPNAYDPDGDSISYELIVPLEASGREVPKYFYPDELPGANSQLDINPITGDLVWDAPNITGEFTVAIRINEYREGRLLNSVVRDMQILVLPCNDTPPIVEAVDEICVVAGTSINIPVTVTDIDTGQMVRISATGGPFELENSPAFLANQNEFQESPLRTTFTWDTKCEHISDAYYQVVFRGQDDSRQGLNGNSVLKSLRIKVVGPPPENLVTEVIEENVIQLNWGKPYACENTLDDSFIGFRIYRREGTNPISLDTCENGLDGKGYEVIKFLTNEMQGDKYFYNDSTAVKGKIYCYRVLANFAQRTSTNQPFRIVESLTSEESCIQLQQDIPLLTEVSVKETSEQSGVISVAWLKPVYPDLDTIENPGPYSYVLNRSEDGVNFIAVNTTEFQFFGAEGFLRTTDTGINTVEKQYFYRVDFYSNNELYSSSAIASSVFSSIVSSDQMNTITCIESVPWQNYLYTLELEDNGATSSVASKVECEFIQDNLTNNDEVCYRIKTTGTYGLLNTPDSLINYSQIVCGIPVDTVGPCPPQLAVSNPCLDINEEPTSEEYINSLSWIGSENICFDGDVASYNIYYSIDSVSLDFELIETVTIGEDYRTVHLPELGISGCYAVTAIDTLSNEGSLSNIVCMANCPIYELPNTFTPNADGANDFFIPRENRFVASVEFKVFNRWGNLIYETNDPEINWDGNTNNGEQYPEGTYYYTCSVLEQGLNEELVEVDFLNGYIQILR